MKIWARLFRWRWYLLAAALVALLAVGACYINLPLRETDKAQIARYLVSWVVEGNRVPGFDVDYPDAQAMPKKKRFMVLCPFVPADVELSADPRVQRVTADEGSAAFKKYGFRDTDYLALRLESESSGIIVVDFANLMGEIAGHGYRFQFRRKLWGLRASGRFLWVS